MTKFMTAAQAANLIQDNDTIGLMGGGGGLMEATHLFEAVRAEFSVHPNPPQPHRHARLGHWRQKDQRHELLRARRAGRMRVIGGHWVWSPAMQQLALDNKIEAYILPGGVSSQLMREIGAERPGAVHPRGPGHRIATHDRVAAR
ncbi:MAG: hypothetical protein U5N53_05890 [Mycobacterium sp.]|nr:hypothetical protein [Mycobacterium sp.]